MVAAHPIELPSSSPAAVALKKLRDGEVLTAEEARLVNATMPVLSAADLLTDTDVDSEAELAFLAGEGPDPWHAAAAP